MNDLAKQNMLQNQKIAKAEGGIDLEELNARIMQEKIQKGQKNDVNFNKKRKDHYRGEFQKAKNTNVGGPDQLGEESKDDGQL